jgi:hypothetical protein
VFKAGPTPGYTCLGKPTSMLCQPQEISAHLHGGIVQGPIFLKWGTMAIPGHQQCQFAVAVVYQVQDGVLC